MTPAQVFANKHRLHMSKQPFIKIPLTKGELRASVKVTHAYGLGFEASDDEMNTLTLCQIKFFKTSDAKTYKFDLLAAEAIDLANWIYATYVRSAEGEK
jgi:hypothetical protein